MLADSAITQRHPAEAHQLQLALAGHPLAIETVINQLGSSNPWLQQIMRETMHDCADPLLWRRLLGCLAVHRWGEYDDSERRSDAQVSELIDTNLRRLFVEDEPGAPSVSVKLNILREHLPVSDEHLRSTAATLLAWRGDARGLNVLIETVHSGDAASRLQAVNALGKLKHERGGPALVEALACDGEALHWEASHALSELGDKALGALLEALKSPKPHVRWHAARALGGIAVEPAAASLAEALNDSDYSVRWAAADALSNLGLMAVRPILERLSRQAPIHDTYEAAHHALHRIGDNNLQARLRPLLAALRSPAPSAAVPMEAYRLLQEWEPQHV